MAQGNGSVGTIITLGVLGAAAYALYEWLVSQCETSGSAFYGGSICQSLIGTPLATTTPVAATPVATPATTTPVSQPSTTQPAATSSLANTLLQAAGFSSAVQTLTPDQWGFYYNNLPGKTAVPPSTFDQMLAYLGLSDATRGTQVTVNQFVAALNSQGLSGLRGLAGNLIPMGMIHRSWS